MKNILLIMLSLICMNLPAKSRKVTLKFVETTDIHGAFFPTDYMSGTAAKGSLARVSSYLKEQRKALSNNVILLENGDILQGQPTNYFWNFINTDDENIAASIVNYLGYDAQAVGNHDIETGHSVYDKWIKELRCPVLGANIVNRKDGKPYVAPYSIIERDGVRIAILGMITPAIPNWLSEDIYSGMMFEDMVSSARKWVDIIHESEHADIIVGLFHSGRSGGITTAEYEEDAAEKVAKEVPGFDVIFYGHDHTAHCDKVRNEKSGDEVWIVDPSNNARKIGEVTVSITLNKNKVTDKQVSAKLVNVDNYDIDAEYMEHFSKDIEQLQQFTQQKVGIFEETVRSRDCFFGPSALTDLVLNLQLKITGADISFNAPLLFDATINKGEVTMADMFNLYKYENKLYVMRMRGKEVKGHLEMSYALWTNRMTSTDDHILLFDDTANDAQRKGFKNFFFNFDSAAGIDYEVDVTKPEGEKVTILRMSNGEPFDENKWYKVAVNSYRGNGGGELITKGAGIPKDSIDSRIIYRSELDQRYYLIKEIERLGSVNPQPNKNWKFVPEDIAQPALIRDRKILFGM